MAIREDLSAARLVQRLEGERRMGVSAARAHLRGDPDRLHQFLRRRAVSQRRLGASFDAVWALRDVRDRDRDQLLGLARQRAIPEHGLAELPERSLYLRRQLAAPLRQGLGRLRVHALAHRNLPSYLVGGPSSPPSESCTNAIGCFAAASVPRSSTRSARTIEGSLEASQIGVANAFAKRAVVTKQQTG